MFGLSLHDPPPLFLPSPPMNSVIQLPAFLVGLMAPYHVGTCRIRLISILGACFICLIGPSPVDSLMFVDLPAVSLPFPSLPPNPCHAQHPPQPAGLHSHAQLHWLSSSELSINSVLCLCDFVVLWFHAW